MLLGSDLLRLPVRLQGIELGKPVDLVLDDRVANVLGLEVACGDRVRRFLPLRAARVTESEIRVASAFALLETQQLEFYRARGRTLSALRDSSVENGGGVRCRVRDVVVDDAYVVTEFEVEDDQGRRRVAASAAHLAA